MASDSGTAPIIDVHHHLWPGTHVGGDDYWEACRIMGARYSDAEQAAMFGGTADRVYSLGVFG